VRTCVREVGCACARVRACARAKAHQNMHAIASAPSGMNVTHINSYCKKVQNSQCFMHGNQASVDYVHHCTVVDVIDDA